MTPSDEIVQNKTHRWAPKKVPNRPAEARCASSQSPAISTMAASGRRSGCSSRAPGGNAKPLLCHPLEPRSPGHIGYLSSAQR